MQSKAWYVSEDIKYRLTVSRPHMFKHRIKQWNLRKNFKLKELGAVAKAVEPFIQAGLPAPTAILEAREVPMSRAKRHFKESFQTSASPRQCYSKRRASDDFEPSPVASDNPNECTNSKRQRRPVQIPRIFLQHSLRCLTGSATPVLLRF